MKAAALTVSLLAWEVPYTLERQGDGSLKITGCSLLNTGRAA